MKAELALKVPGEEVSTLYYETETKISLGNIDKEVVTAATAVEEKELVEAAFFALELELGNNRRQGQL